MGVVWILDRMALLSDADIRQYLAKRELRIEPFDEKNLTPNGYDVTIEEVLVPSSNTRTTQGVAQIPPATRFAVSTRESVGLGRHVAGQLWLRTTWARRGVLAAFGMIDSGFSGTLTFGALNGGSEVLEVPIGERFAQIVFVSLESRSSETYEKRCRPVPRWFGCGLPRHARLPVPRCNTRGQSRVPRSPRTRPGGGRTPYAGGRG